MDQLEGEIISCLDFLKRVYGIFGFTFNMALSTRPQEYMGTLEQWALAEETLRIALDKSGSDWVYNEGDGAFYGPKIDIRITDALRRPHQCGTIQLDFQGPLNFDMKYVSGTEGQFERPVVIHRAVLGSIERMVAILLENYGGKWPFWLSPRQVVVIPVGVAFYEYAQQVQQRLHAAGFFAEADLSGDQLGKKIRNSRICNFALVVGPKELENGTANVRVGEELFGEKTIEHIIVQFAKLKATFNPNNVIE